VIILYRQKDYSSIHFCASYLVRLTFLTDEENFRDMAEQQLNFLTKIASPSPMGHAMFLRALLEHTNPPMKITVVTDDQTDKSRLPLSLPPNAVAILLEQPSDEYPLVNGKTTYYVCRDHSCLPPTNDLHKLV